MNYDSQMCTIRLHNDGAPSRETITICIYFILFVVKESFHQNRLFV